MDLLIKWANSFKYFFFAFFLLLGLIWEITGDVRGTFFYIWSSFLVLRYIKGFHGYLFPLIASLIVLIIYTLYPNVFVDDTGFVIRYLNQAQAGCFYCYNLSDGPIYGISGFLYGVVTIMLAITGIFSPETILLLVGVLGLFFLTLALLRIINIFFNHSGLSIITVISIMLFSSNFLTSATIGLETNFHLAIVFWGVYFFMSGKEKWMWLFFALSVISKLDATPLVLILSNIYIYQNKKKFLSLQFNQWKYLLIYGVFPVLVFILISFLLFDGPLPQSASAKINYHLNTSDHWFPFGELMFDKTFRKILVVTAGMAFLLHLTVAIYKKEFKLKEFSLGFAFIGTMVLYKIYNPAERMIWYYAMPELLIFSQLFVSAYFVFHIVEKEKHRVYWFFTIIIIGFGLFLTKRDKKWMGQYLNTVEIERKQIGKYIGDKLKADDTLVASHGLYGAYTSAYVFDMSGLNSKRTTDLKLNMDTLMNKYHPTYFIHNGYEYFLGLANNYGYHVDTVFYHINKYNYPTWVLFKKSDVKGHISRLENEMFQVADEYSSQKTFPFNVKKLWIGIENKEDKSKNILIEVNDTTYAFTLPPLDEEKPSESIQTIKIDFSVETNILNLSLKDSNIIIYDPIIMGY